MLFKFLTEKNLKFIKKNQMIIKIIKVLVKIIVLINL